MTVLRVLTVDDEALALRRLKLILQTIPNIEHVGEANSCNQALISFKTLLPDVILLDIKLRDGDGFEIVEQLSRQTTSPSIVFVTGFDYYACRAFDTAAVDYLLKPVDRDRLLKALMRVQHELRSTDVEQRVGELQEIIRNLRSAVAGRNGEPYDTEFWLRGADGLVRVPLEAIECVSSEDDYIAFHTSRGSQLMRGSLRKFETRVEPGHFTRIHRRWLVRKATIVELKMQAPGRPEVILKSGKALPVGRLFLKGLRKSLLGADGTSA